MTDEAASVKNRAVQEEQNKVSGPNAAVDTKSTKPASRRRRRAKPRSTASQSENTEPQSEQQEPKPKEAIPSDEAKRAPKKISQRKAELTEVRKQFRTALISSENTKIYLVPTDPEFALPLSVLELQMNVPRHYPRNHATIIVENEEIPRGVSANVEVAFNSSNKPLATRLQHISDDMERLLTMKPRETIKIVKLTKKPISLEDKEKMAALRKFDLKSVLALDDQMKQLDTSAKELDGEEPCEFGDEPDLPIISKEDDQKERNRDMDQNPRRGTELLLTSLKFTGISIMEVVSCNVVVACSRCKHQNEVLNLRPLVTDKSDQRSKPRVVPCEKCSLGLLTQLRKEFVHSASYTLGFFDVSGCSLVDFISASFAVTCENCDTISMNFKQVDLGRPFNQPCRDCHHKMSIQIDDFRYDRISSDDIGQVKPLTQKGTNQEKVTLSAGQPLEKEGTCKHYRKSQRWFRFGCCKRVYPCDRCHDNEQLHEADQITRMICGFCSKEQRFAEKCASCGHSFAVRRSAFWEGGKGTRNQTKMSRKDPRKYKRI